MILREAAPIYEALDMKPTLNFQMPDDGIKVCLHPALPQ